MLLSGYQEIYDKDHAGPLYGHGWTDVTLGGKIRVLENRAREWMLSYVPAFTLPSGRDSTPERFGVSEDFVKFTQSAVFSQTWKRWNVNLDSGYALPYGGSRRGYRGDWASNLALGYRVYPWLQPELELNYAHGYWKAQADSDLFSLTAGFVMPIHERLRINAGAQQGLAGSQSDQSTTVKIVTTLFL